MEFEKPREKSGLGTGPLVQFGKISSSLISDSLRIARLAFVYVSAAETMTEDATNTDEWGPTTKAMAEISNASKNYDDYERIVQVLRARLALTGTKKWRQIFKALTVIEYLLTHGPVQFVVEFRADKKRVEELTRFVFVDENLIDRGSALQSKAKQVHKLLVDEIFFKKERSRAQTVSKGILGFGSQPVETYGGSDTCERSGFKTNSSQPAGTLSLKEGKAAHLLHDRKNGTFNSDPSSPISQRSTNWSASLASSGDDSPQMSSTSSEWNPFDESPTSSESFTSSSSPIAGGWTPPVRDTFPTRKFSLESDTYSTSSSRPDSLLKPEPSPLVKLPLPTCRVPPPPPGGSKVGSNSQRNSSVPRPQTVSSFITM
ncbi:hypothetical protein KC19_1G040700 [Ceratodon purpureus]|uniref:ENTH domain-containing protein n=1 Tax=Ceratodon purpureus TaxID=3225 RepID=A0A8T0J192_CERPU|nr:hypothetical protein KC19_1G040700 [Ceratodon purpureus]KAG0589699.1 hypothetical protein KC19_1G040700 [Ceratodon purpureus]KAG0589700.1 hypothetical protein KC19_1G040700 [Ceratodon purpureus]